DEVGAQPSERERHRGRHADFLAPGAEQMRLDPSWDEVGPACERDDPQVAAEPAELAQKVHDIRLVTGAAAAEDIRIDHDRARHPTARSYDATTAAVVAPQPNAPARARPAARSSSLRPSARSIPAAIESVSRGSTS